MSISLLCISQAVKRNDGHWVYPLDDPYIHFAIAKTFAANGIWGITEQSGFASGSSSLFYTGLLSGLYRLTGFHEITGLVVNVVAGLVLLWWLAGRLRRETSSSFCQFLILASVLLFTPLVVIILSGMEHTLHVLFSVVFLFDAVEVLAKPESEAERRPGFVARLMILSLLLPVVRYEALFLVCLVSGFLLLRGKWPLAFTMGALALLPGVIYGWVSVSHGWYALPNSVLLKGNSPGPGGSAIMAFLTSGYEQLVANLHMYGIAVAAAVGLLFHARRHAGFWERRTLISVIFLSTLGLHMQFAKTAWLYRYEAYVVGMGMVVLGLTMLVPFYAKLREGRLSLVEAGASSLFAFMLMWPTAMRGKEALQIVSRASTNVYEQQYQMARFLQEFYPEAKVAANDIGAISCFTNIDCLDLIGIASNEVLRAKRAGKYDTAFIRDLATKRGVEIAIVYDFPYQSFGGLPAEWTKVGEWKLFSNVVLGGDTVSFYAVKPELAADLGGKLRQFSPRLPKTIEQRGAFLANP